MLTRALLVLLAMMTGLAAGPADAASRAPQPAVSISVQSGGVDAARAEARVVAHAHLSVDYAAVETTQNPRIHCQLGVGRTVERGDRLRQ